MAGMEPVRRDNPVTDVTLAANVNRERSPSQQAVDARVDARAAPAVSDALSNDPAIRTQVTSLVTGLVNASSLSTSHIGRDTDGTPFYDPGNRTYAIKFDVDGTPYYV